MREQRKSSSVTPDAGRRCGRTHSRFAAVLPEMKPSRSDAVDTVQHSLVWNSSAALGRKVKLVPTWSGPLGEEMAGNVLLPGENARIAPTTFDQWLAAGAR